jgi:phytoene synthase
MSLFKGIEGDPAAICAADVRRHDFDRWLTALFAPDADRSALHAVYAFNLALARVPESVTDPLLGEIRMQWWREQLEGVFAGERLADPVCQALAKARARRSLGRALCFRLLEERARDLRPRTMPTLQDLLDYSRATSSTVMQLALEALGVASAAATDAATSAGIGYALAGLLRAVPYHARQGRIYLPADLLARRGILETHVLDRENRSALGLVLAEVAAQARLWLDRARLVADIPKAALPALLPAALADLYLDRLRLANFDPEDPRLAVGAPHKQWALLWRAWRGRF